VLKGGKCKMQMQQGMQQGGASMQKAQPKPQINGGVQEPKKSKKLMWITIIIIILIGLGIGAWVFFS